MKTYEKLCKRCGKLINHLPDFSRDIDTSEDSLEDSVAGRPYGLEDGTIIYFCSRACYRKWAEKRNKERNEKS
jgi:hypothetical protein